MEEVVAEEVVDLDSVDVGEDSRVVRIWINCLYKRFTRCLERQGFGIDCLWTKLVHSAKLSDDQ